VSKLDRSFFFIIGPSPDNCGIEIDDPKSEELLRSLKRGTWYRADIRSDRKHGPLRHWWAGLAWMLKRWEGLGNNEALLLWPTTRKLNDALLIQLGYHETWHHLDGTIQVRADSIRFEAMAEAEFEAMFEKARVLTLDRWGIDPWEEWKAEQQAKKDAEGK
jgi:hypothetical protein